MNKPKTNSQTLFIILEKERKAQPRENLLRYKAR